MTRNQFSNKSLIERFGASITLGEIISELESDVEMFGEVICGIELNGRRVEESEETELFPTPIAEIENLSIVTGRPFHLAKGVIDNWTTTLPKLMSSSENVGSSVRFEGISASGPLLGELFDTCQYFVDSLALLKNQFSKSDDFTRVAEDWAEQEAQLSRVVREVFQAVDRGDQTVVADLIEYDLVESLGRWRELLVHLCSVFFIAEKQC